jgi:hypothetical protein
MTRHAHRRCHGDHVQPHQRGSATTVVTTAPLLSTMFFLIGLAIGLSMALYSPLRILMDGSFITTITTDIQKTSMCSYRHNNGFLDDSTSSFSLPGQAPELFRKTCLWYQHDLLLTIADKQTGQYHHFLVEESVKVTSSYGTVEGTTFIVRVAGWLQYQNPSTMVYQCGRESPLRTTILSINHHNHNDDDNNNNTDYPSQFIRIDCAPNRPLMIQGSTHACPSLDPGQYTKSSTKEQPQSLLKPCLWYGRDLFVTIAGNSPQDQQPLQVISSYGTVEGTSYIVMVVGRWKQTEGTTSDTTLYQCGRQMPLRTTLLSTNHYSKQNNNNPIEDYQYYRIDCASSLPLMIQGSSQTTCPSLDPGQHRISSDIMKQPQQTKNSSMNTTSFELR